MTSFWPFLSNCQYFINNVKAWALGPDKVKRIKFIINYEGINKAMLNYYLIRGSLVNLQNNNYYSYIITQNNVLLYNALYVYNKFGCF